MRIPEVCPRYDREWLPWSWKEETRYRHDGLSVFLLELAEAASVYYARNYLPHIEWLTGVYPDYPMKLGRGIERVLWDSRGLRKPPCGLLALCPGYNRSRTYSHLVRTGVAQVAYDTPRDGDRVLVISRQVVCDTAFT